MKILVVDDEKLVVKGIKFNLEHDGYEVVTAFDGESAVALTSSEKPDLVILDLMMPKLDGLEACMQIRAFSNVPIIMLTARSEDADKLLGFESGADDYVTKPFNILELKARIRALLRRAGAERSAAQPESQQLRCGNLVLDLASRSALRDGVPVTLTAKEFDLMELFLRNPRQIIPAERFLERIWGYDSEAEINVVWAYISYLRRKLESLGANVRIVARRGQGYLLEEIS